MQRHRQSSPTHAPSSRQHDAQQNTPAAAESEYEPLAYDEQRPLNAQSIFALQRMVGNQAVQRMIAGQPAQVQQRIAMPVIHRKQEFGLATSGLTQSFVNKAHTWINDEANKDKSFDNLRAKLGDLVNAELNSVGVPSAPAVMDPGGTMGTFSFSTWTLKVNPNDFSQDTSKTKISELTKAEAAEIVDTFYHEARHAEQWFRMAQAKAGEGWDADKINSKIGIPKTIAEEAVKAKLPPLTPELRAAIAGLFGEGIAKVIEDVYGQITGFYESVYGANSKYRGLILNSTFRTQINTVRDQSRAVTSANHATTKSTLAPIMTDWETNTLPNKIDTEITRIEAISSKSDNDNKMLTHLKAMKTGMESVIALWKADDSVDGIKKLAAEAGKVASARYAGYRDLPEEADAWAVGGAVTTAYNAK